jgi:hypothetical protein
LSGKLGQQSSRFRTAKTFFFGITVFLYKNENPGDHVIHWRQFYTSLNNGEGKFNSLFFDFITAE